MNFLIGPLLLVAALGQASQADPYKEWSDVRVERELKSARKKSVDYYNDEHAPQSWKKMLAAEVELIAMESKLSEARRSKSKSLDALRALPEVKQRMETYESYSKEIQSLSRERDRRYLKNGHQPTLARQADLQRLKISSTESLHRLKLDVLNFPRIDGSTSTQPLAVLIACKCFQAPSKWVGKYEDYRRFEPGRAFAFTPTLDLDEGRPKPEPEFQLFEYALRADAINPSQERLASIINSLLVVNASTHESYLNLIDGRSDLGLIARRPSARELESARAKGVELEVHPAAVDALVFLVNREQPVDKLSTAQIRDIYQGKVRTWKELGGRNEVINAYQRPEDSGSQELILELVMKDAEMETPKVNLIGYQMSGIYLNLTKDREGVAYSVHYYEQYMIGSSDTKTIAIDGVLPSFESIQARTYPHVSEVFVAIRKSELENAPARRLRDWILSEEGQKVVRESGYVPVVKASE